MPLGSFARPALVTQEALTAPDETAINSGDTGTDTAIRNMKSRVLQLEQTLSRLGLLAARPATFACTTTGAATLTLAAFTVSRSTVVDWGDGSTSTYTGSGTRTHSYAGAGTWTVAVSDPLAVTALTLSDNKITLNSWNIAPMANMVTFIVTAVKDGTFNSADISAWRPTTFSMYSMPAGYAGTFNSADISAWRPTDFRMYSMPAGYAGTFNSADVSAWQPTTFYLNSMPSGYAGTFNSVDVSAWRPASFLLFAMPSGYAGTFNSADVSAWRPTAFYLNSMPSGYAGTFNSVDVSAWRPASFLLFAMPAGYAGTFNSADVSAWRPTAFYMYSMPAATYTITIMADGFAAWSTGLNNFQMQSNSLTQAQVNAILWDLYQAAKTPRTATGGTINVGGTNAAPSGTFQAATACPVTSGTPGKEIAHELLNDGCAVGYNKWTTVTVTA